MGGALTHRLGIQASAPGDGSGVLAYIDADTTVLSTDHATWNAESYDGASYHNIASDTERLTIPPGVTRGRVIANIKVDGAFDDMLLRVNGTNSFMGRAALASNSAGDCSANGASAVIATTPSDYYSLYNATAGPFFRRADFSWLAFEPIDPATKGALVHKTANQSITATTTTTLTWDTETSGYDTDGFHDNTTNNSRLTVPSGCTRARLSFNVKTPSAAGQMIAVVSMNGAQGIPGLPMYENDTPGTDNLNGFGAWIDVVAGDYFELDFYQGSGANMSLADDNALWFCIEAK